jgi:hypothetical protein
MVGKGGGVGGKPNLNHKDHDGEKQNLNPKTFS